MTAILFLLLQAALQASPGAAQASQNSMTFDQLVQRALAQNKSLAAERERLRQAEARLTQAGLRPNPSLEVSNSTDVVFANEGENGLAVTLSKPFETAGKRSKRIGVAEAEVALAKAETADAERQLAGQLRAAWLRAAETASRLSFLDRTRGLNQKMVQVMKVRLAAGDASSLDSHLLQAENNRVEAQRLQAESQLADQMLEIRKLAGLAPEDAVSVSLSDLRITPPPANEAQLIETALRARPDLQAARLREAMADAGIVLARSQAVPDIIGSVRYIREPDISRFVTATQPRAFEKDNLIEFGISIPLPFSNREQGNIAEASSKGRQAAAERQALENNIKSEVAAALRRYQSASRALDLIRTGVVDETQAGFSITQLSYRLGNARLLDVIMQQRSLIDAQLAEVAAQAELAAAQANLEMALGGSGLGTK